MSVERAIMKMTSMPAKLLKLADRGTLTEGVFADLVVFDPATIDDRATFEEPHQYPVGVEYVFVNGQLVVQRGEHTEARAGRVVRPVGERG
jgi:N-acyl-D-aspartate/D-glutamate deacylase